MWKHTENVSNKKVKIKTLNNNKDQINQKKKKKNKVSQQNDSLRIGTF